MAGCRSRIGKSTRRSSVAAPTSAIRSGAVLAGSAAACSNVIAIRIVPDGTKASHRILSGQWLKPDHGATQIYLKRPLSFIAQSAANRRPSRIASGTSFAGLRSETRTLTPVSAPLYSRPVAPVAELVDAPDSKSGTARCAGSSPARGTNKPQDTTHASRSPASAAMPCCRAHHTATRVSPPSTRMFWPVM